MKKTTKYFLIVIAFVVACLTFNVDAATKSKSYPGVFMNENSDMQLFVECNGTLGNPSYDSSKKTQDVAYYLQLVLDVMKYAGIVICIALTAKEFALAIINNDKDGFRPALQKGIKRLAFACVLFFLPIIINAAMQLVGMYSDPTCGIK